MNRKELKEKIKKNLKGKYGDIAKLLVIYYGLILSTIIVGNSILKINLFEIGIAKLSKNIILFLLIPLLSTGIISFFLKLSRNEKVTYKELFSKTNYFVKNLCFSLLIFIYLLLVTATVVIALMISFVPFKGIDLLLGLYIFFVYPILMMGVIAICYAYTIWCFITLDNKNLNVIEALKLGGIMMHGHKWELFKLNLYCIVSYTLGIIICFMTDWNILKIFMLGILLIIVVPYNLILLANFYESIKNSKDNN